MIPFRGGAAAMPVSPPAAHPNRVYNLGLTTGYTGGFLEGQAALAQAIFLILHTQRYAYPIYPHSYGVELAELMGKPIPYVLPEIKRRVTEALLQDDRITGVDGWEFDTQRGKVTASFVVHTPWGTFPQMQEVAI